MTNKKLILSLAAIGLLAGCSKQMSTIDSAAGTNLASSTQAVQNNSEAQKSLDLLEATLRSTQKTKIANGADARSAASALALDNSQISAILGNAGLALNSAGLSKSNDLLAIIPALIGGSSMGVGSLNLGSLQSSNLMALIANGSLSSILSLANGSGLQATLVQSLSSSLFQNLPLAGITSGNLPSSAGALISALTGKLGSSGMNSAGISSLLQSLSSGALLGIGGMSGLGMSPSMFASILSRIGAGSVTGIAGISVPGGLNTSTFQSLLGAFTSGSNLGLGQLAGSQVISSSSITSLLGSLMQGQSAALPNTAMGVSNQQVVSSFLQSLFSRLGR